MLKTVDGTTWSFPLSLFSYSPSVAKGKKDVYKPKIGKQIIRQSIIVGKISSAIEIQTADFPV